MKYKHKMQGGNPAGGKVEVDACDDRVYYTLHTRKAICGDRMGTAAAADVVRSCLLFARGCGRVQN